MAIKVEGHIWLTGPQGLHFGKGRFQLLEQILVHESISEAARQLDMSYRKAWAMVKEMNQTSTKPLVDKQVGGLYGGRTIVTAEGKKWIERYRNLQRDFELFKKAKRS